MELLFGTQSASIGQGLNDGTSGGGIGLGACFLETDPWTLDGALPYEMLEIACPRSRRVRGVAWGARQTPCQTCDYTA